MIDDSGSSPEAQEAMREARTRRPFFPVPPENCDHDGMTVEVGRGTRPDVILHRCTECGTETVTEA